MKNTVFSIWRFYVDGFRSMTLGRTLWFIILVKLFFPNFLSSVATDGDKEGYVSNELIERAVGDSPPSISD